jgi:hypothetical protein
MTAIPCLPTLHGHEQLPSLGAKIEVRYDAILSRHVINSRA